MIGKRYWAGRAVIVSALRMGLDPKELMLLDEISYVETHFTIAKIMRFLKSKRRIVS